MLNAFSVENYRSFRDRATVELRPITLLLGRNSSGKSSLTRFIPLLQQSMDRRTSSPILWNSDEVDFGDIDNVLSHRTQGDPAVRITLDITASAYHNFVVSTSPYLHHISDRFALTGDFRLTASLGANEGRTQYRSLRVQYEDYDATLHFAGSSIATISLGERVLEDAPQPQDTYLDPSRLFPLLLFRRQIQQASKQDGAPAFRYEPTFAYAGLNRAHTWFINKKTSAQRIEYNRNRLFFVSATALQRYVETLDNTVNSKLASKQRVNDLGSAIFVQSLPSIVSYCEQVLRPTLERASYLGPSRASGARFYRYQELAVERIDSRGENLPMYLSSLDDTRMASFNEILSSAFDYQVRIGRPSGHASIELSRAGTNRFENLADVGFGFSQLLPIVAQIHAGRTAPAYISPRLTGVTPDAIFAIEQPELHLHPASQAGLGDLIAGAINTAPKNRTQRFLVETHSESLVSRLGELVAAGSLKPEAVILYFVEKEDFQDTSALRVGTFLKTGEVSGWPIGFFSSSL